MISSKSSLQFIDSEPVSTDERIAASKVDLIDLFAIEGAREEVKPSGQLKTLLRHVHHLGSDLGGIFSYGRGQSRSKLWKSAEHPATEMSADDDFSEFWQSKLE